MITERLLQFIWQFQYFSKQALSTLSGEKLDILYAGRPNTNQGPDFLDARIKIDNTVWAGHVELHLKTSLWRQHGHHLDDNYNNVILHIVWENDEPLQDSSLPVLVLQDRISKLLLHQYKEWMDTPSFIPCGSQILQVNRIVWLTWKERLLVERLQRKSAIVFTYLEQNNRHWEETFWWLLARNFGIKVNAEAFEAVARSLPLTVLARHKQQQPQLEALLLGQAGLLDDDPEEPYPQLLQKEYRFYQHKYALKRPGIAVHFLRMRPGNFPGVRLAQLAALIHRSEHLFSTIREMTAVEEVKQLLDVTASEYWDHHYRFDTLSPCKPKKIGQSMADNIIINTIVPILFAYGHLYNEPVYKDRMLQWLEKMAPERNTITTGFIQLGCINQNAFDSQAYIELLTNYCNPRKCLDCAAGNAILKQTISR